MMTRSIVAQEVQRLPPSSFAFVMATGIVSIAASLQGHTRLAWVLCIVNLAAYALLWGAMIARLSAYQNEIVGDMTNSARAPGFLTIVAGTCVLGSQVFMLFKNAAVGLALWMFGAALWVVLLYGILAVQIASERKATIAEGMNGTWLLITVATQSVAVLGALLAPHMQVWRDQLLFISFGCFLLGGLLYVIVVTMVLYRVLFHPLPAEAMTPPYWIDMGAEAISTLAGANLILHAGAWNVLQDLLPFLKGLTVLFWATATWWIPLLLLLGIWRHLYRRVPVQYSAQYWSLVFPLGMYAACTSQLMKAMALPLAPALPAIFLYVALGAWAVTLWGLLFTYLLPRVPAFTAGS